MSTKAGKRSRRHGAARIALCTFACVGFVAAASGQARFGLHLAPSAPNEQSPERYSAPESAAVAEGDKRAAQAEEMRALLGRMRRAVNERVRTQEGDIAGCRAEPSSPAIGANVPESYFGPAPSSVNPSLVGPLQLLTSGPLDERARTITIPLYRGEMARSGENVWYILTDTTDQGNALSLGLNFAQKLNFANTGRGARTATLLGGGVVQFDQGTVDFTPERRVVAGGERDRAFPPQVAEPGSVGDVSYSALVRIRNAGNHIYNAPVISFGTTAEEIDAPGGNVDFSKVHDSVVAIDIEDETVTLSLTAGFSFGRPVLYLSTDTSTQGTAALEGATYAPGLADISVGADDSAFSAVERIFVMANGATGCANPHRQGLSAAIADGESPFSVLGGIPTIATDYSPLWDVNLGEWTVEAIRRGYRARLIDEFQILSFVEFGFLTGPGGAEYGSVGAIVNCPIVFRFL